MIKNETLAEQEELSNFEEPTSEVENLHSFDDPDFVEDEFQRTPLPENYFPLTLSRTLTSQIKNLSKYEGIDATDLMIELISEGITRRVLEDQTRPAPSHLMTRNGYVHNDAQTTQPIMSHHTMQPNGNVRLSQNSNQRNKNNFQPRSNSGQARTQQGTRYNRNFSNTYQNGPRPQNNYFYNNQNKTSDNNSQNFKPNKKSEF